MELTETLTPILLNMVVRNSVSQALHDSIMLNSFQILHTDEIFPITDIHVLTHDDQACKP